MKRILILVLLAVLHCSLHANPSMDKNILVYNYVQIKAINLTNEVIEFYVNRLYAPREIEPNESYITYSIPIYWQTN
jgi:hypothetical protein